MNLYIKHEGRDWNAHTSEVFRLLGLKPGSHLPPEGMPPREIQGIRVWVTPKPEGEPRSVCSHRVLAECPVCKKHLSVGRLHQHAKIHQIKETN